MSVTNYQSALRHKQKIECLKQIVILTGLVIFNLKRKIFCRFHAEMHM